MIRIGGTTDLTFQQQAGGFVNSVHTVCNPAGNAKYQWSKQGRIVATLYSEQRLQQSQNNLESAEAECITPETPNIYRGFAREQYKQLAEVLALTRS
jgi:hypothetical protein